MATAVQTIPVGEVIPTPNTKEWLAWRQKGLGASDVPTILGVNPYRSPLELWAEKRGILEVDFTGNRFTTMGHRMEPVIASLYEEETTGVDLVYGVTRRHADLAYLFATPDRLIYPHAGDRDRLDALLECKNRSERSAAKWGEAGTDQVPEDVLAQVLTQLAVWPEAQHCDVAALIGGNDFRVYRIHRDAQVEAAILQHVAEFWQMVQDGTEPRLEGARLSEYVTRRFRAHDAELLTADMAMEETLSSLVLARARQKELDARVDELEALVKHAIGEHAGLQGMAAKATWKAAKDSSKTDWESIATALHAAPELIAQHTTVKEGSRRFLLTSSKAAE